MHKQYNEHPKDPLVWNKGVRAGCPYCLRPVCLDFNVRRFNLVAMGLRLGEEMTQPEFSKRLGISKSHLNDIEKGRKAISLERAARFAQKLCYSEERFISLAIQSQIDDAGLHYRVELENIA